MTESEGVEWYLHKHNESGRPESDESSSSSSSFYNDSDDPEWALNRRRWTRSVSSHKTKKRGGVRVINLSIVFVSLALVGCAVGLLVLLAKKGGGRSGSSSSVASNNEAASTTTTDTSTSSSTGPANDHGLGPTLNTNNHTATTPPTPAATAFPPLEATFPPLEATFPPLGATFPPLEATKPSPTPSLRPTTTTTSATTAPTIPTASPTALPSSSVVPTFPTLMGEEYVPPNPVPLLPLPSYFNYDVDDLLYGPTNWPSVDMAGTYVSEFAGGYYDNETSGTRSVWNNYLADTVWSDTTVNRCYFEGRQSPIHLHRTTNVETTEGFVCSAIHQIRSRVRTLWE
jgi:hypothetical protein